MLVATWRFRGAKAAGNRWLRSYANPGPLEDVRENEPISARRPVGNAWEQFRHRARAIETSFDIALPTPLYLTLTPADTAIPVPDSPPGFLLGVNCLNGAPRLEDERHPSDTLGILDTLGKKRLLSSVAWQTTKFTCVRVSLDQLSPGR